MVFRQGSPRRNSDSTGRPRDAPWEGVEACGDWWRGNDAELRRRSGESPCVGVGARDEAGELGFESASRLPPMYCERKASSCTPPLRWRALGPPGVLGVLGVGCWLARSVAEPLGYLRHPGSSQRHPASSQRHPASS
jgi:hypothetical protein